MGRAPVTEHGDISGGGLREEEGLNRGINLETLEEWWAKHKQEGLAQMKLEQEFPPFPLAVSLLRERERQRSRRC